MYNPDYMSAQCTDPTGMNFVPIEWMQFTTSPPPERLARPYRQPVVRRQVTKLRKYTKDEIIAGLRKALEFYQEGRHLSENDTWNDDCSGFYRTPGAHARNALQQYNESTSVSERKPLIKTFYNAGEEKYDE